MDYDIAIIGAGPSGLSFALSLRNQGLKVALFEKCPVQELAEPAYDGREIALTHLSKKLMIEHGSWARIKSGDIAPLFHAQVIDGQSDYTLAFDPPEAGRNGQQDPLGFMVANQHIRKAIFEEFQENGEAVLIDDVSVKKVWSDAEAGHLELEDGRVFDVGLIVAADSRFSATRSQMGIGADVNDFGRNAILCTMRHEKPNHHTALECFFYGRTLAVLPLNGNRSSMVMTVKSGQVPGLLAMDNARFTHEVEQLLGGRLGEMTVESDRFHYPLVGVHAKRFYANRFALIGDAAVGMHPVTAHGFNLGLSGQDLLAKEIIRAHKAGRAFWNPSVLRRYEIAHMVNTRPLYYGTNGIVGLFTNDLLPARLLRKFVLRASNNLPPVKQAIRFKLMSKSHLLRPFPQLRRKAG